MGRETQRKASLVVSCRRAVCRVVVVGTGWVASPVCTELPINHDRGSSLNLFTSAILEPPL